MFDKWKARLVAGGNFVDTSLAGDISAHVVNPISVMTMLSIAAFKELVVGKKNALDKFKT